jgi:hypothetical protein
MTRSSIGPSGPRRERRDQVAGQAIVVGGENHADPGALGCRGERVEDMLHVELFAGDVDIVAAGGDRRCNCRK